MINLSQNGQKFWRQEKRQMINYIKNNKISTLIIIGLLLIMIFVFKTNGDDVKGKTVYVNGKPYEVVKHVVDTQYVNQYKTVFKDGKTIYIDTVVYVDVPKDADTTEILKDYFSKVTYDDTLKLDENLGFISVKDTIFKNSILSRKWTTSINKMYIRDSIFLKELPKNEFFIGGIIGYGNSVPYIGPSLLFKNKKEDIYNLNIGLDLNKNLLYQVGFAKKIKLRK